VTLAAAEDRTVNFAARFRPGEIHGVHFDDSDQDGIRDAGEAGIEGTTIFIDLDRDDIYDEGVEPSTYTGAGGEYSFTGMEPGAYVVRTIVGSERHRSYPGTGGGILWPAGVSNLAVGDVTPGSISVSLANGESHRQNV